MATTLEETKNLLVKQEKNILLWNRVYNILFLVGGCYVFYILTTDLPNNAFINISKLVFGLVFTLAIYERGSWYIFTREWAIFRLRYDEHHVAVRKRLGKLLHIPADSVYVRTSPLENSFTITVENKDDKKTLDVQYTGNDFTYMQ